MRTTFKKRLSTALAVLALATMSGVNITSADTVLFASPRAAFEQGIGAYRAGQYKIARQALEYAHRANHLRATLELAELLDDEDNPNNDRKRAYDLVEKIVRDHVNIDVRWDRRVPVVALAVIKYADMLKNGVPEKYIEPDLGLAVANLEYAAGQLRNKQAQFELHRIYLSGALGDARRRRGLQWLSRSVKNGYGPAMALMAKMLWRGDGIRRNGPKALRLIRRARNRIAPRDRLWVEDLHHEIYCGSSPTDRSRVAGYSRDRQSPSAPNTLHADAFGGVTIARSCNDKDVDADAADQTNAGWDAWRQLERGVDYDDSGRTFRRKPAASGNSIRAERPATNYNGKKSNRNGGAGLTRGLGYSGN